MSNASNNNVAANTNSNNGVYPAEIENRVTVKGEEEMNTAKLWFNKEQFATLQPHPYAEFLPMIASKHELEALKEGIRKRGLLEPITILDGKILDGRNRHRAICELVDREKNFNYDEAVKFAHVPEGFTPEQYVITRNLHRRNLNESQRALFAGLMLLEFKEDKTLTKEEKAKLPKGNKTDHFGKIFNVSGSSVKSAQIVIKHGLPIVKESVQKGVWRLSLARKIAELKPEDQTLLVEDALDRGREQADKWHNKYVLDLNSRKLELAKALEESNKDRDTVADALRRRLKQELTEAIQLSGDKQSDKEKEIAAKEETIENGTHPDLKGHTQKIKKNSESLEVCLNEQKKMLDDAANQKELYAQSKLAQCMIGSYKQFVRSRNQAAVVVVMNFSGKAPEVEFKVVQEKQASKFLGTLKKFSNPGEGEQFLAANKAGLDALKSEILNGPLVEAPIKIQAFTEGLTDSNAA